MSHRRDTEQHQSIFISLLVLSICAALLLTPLQSATADRETDRDYIALPGNVPNFHDYETPVLREDDNEPFEFSITNRYNDTMMDITLIVEIYRMATIDDSREMRYVNAPPEFVAGNDYVANESGFAVMQERAALSSNATWQLTFSIETPDDATKGTFLVRSSIAFEYNGTGENCTYTMRSRGHFTDEEWDDATHSIDDHSATGNINLTALGVDGIIPDTSFQVGYSSDSDEFIPGFECTAAGAALLCALYAVRRRRVH